MRDGITAIVGPNGCGKSNIADAISWTLGEQSLRTLRSSRMEELIFSGSSEHAPLSMAEVSLLLTPAGNPSSREFEPLRISRRLYRSGESEFQMNGSRCRLRDVLDKFMGTGLWTKAYSIIEQGRVEYIINSKPAEIRLLLEEAAGITKYKVKRNLAQNRLQSAEANLLRLNDIISEVERQRNSLKRQAARARRYKNLRERFRQVEKKLFARKYRQEDKQKRELSASLSKLEEERDKLRLLLRQKEKRSEALAAELEQREQKLQELNHQLYQINLKKERNENESFYSLKRAEDYAAGLEENRRFIEISNKQLNSRLEENKGIEEQIQQENIEAEKIAKELAHQEEIISRIEEEHRLLKDELREINSNFLAKNKHFSELKNRLNRFQEEEVKIFQQKKIWEKELAQLKSQEKSLTKESTIKEEEYDQQEQYLKKHKKEEENLYQHTIKLREKIHQQQELYRKHKDEIRQLGHRLRFLQQLIANSFPHLNALRVLKKVITTEESSPIWDILANHIEVDKKYETAVESLLDDLLHAVVVDSPETALKAIAFLHSQRLGYCTFIAKNLFYPAEISNTHELQSLLKQKGVIGRISDYIKISPLLEKNLESIVTKTVLIETIEDGLRLREHFPDYIMVTIKGEKLYPNGIIAGGSKNKQPGLLSLERQKEETMRLVKEKYHSLKKLKKQLEGDITLSQKIEAELEAKAEENQELMKEHSKQEQGLIKIRTQLSSISQRVLYIEKELERLKQNNERVSHNKKEAEEVAASAEQDMREQESQISELQKKLKQCEENLSRTRDIANEHKAKLSLLAERKNSLNRELKRLKEDIDSVTEQQKEKKGQVEELRQKQSKAIELAEKLKEELQGCAEEIKRLENQISQARSSTISEKEEHRELGERIKNLRLEAEDKQEKVNQHKLSLTEIESSLKHLSQDCRSSLQKSIEQLLSEEKEEEKGWDLKAYELEKEDISGKLSRIGAVNLMAFEEFNRLDERYQFLTQQRQDIADSIKSLQKAIRKINQISRQKFRQAFTAINQNFKQTFRYFFSGGGAELSLLDEADILESGITIKAQPPGKRLQNINLLSGGEKALTAIALLMAIFQFRPSPFCLLDEIDATLDEANIGKLISMLQQLKQKTQFIIITHNPLTMEAADLIYGVTMEKPGISKVLSVKFREPQNQPISAKEV